MHDALRWARRLAAVLIGSAVMVSMATPAFAWTYNRTGARYFADTYWNSANLSYVYFDRDCANFTSQCMHVFGGQLPNDWDAPTTWNYDIATDAYTRSWTIAYEQYTFIKCEPRGASYLTARQLYLGDLVYYDWTGDGRIDHVAIVTGFNADGQPVVSAHNSNRHNVYWDLKAVGAPSTTRYYLVHVNSTGTN